MDFQYERSQSGVVTAPTPPPRPKVARQPDCGGLLVAAAIALLWGRRVSGKEPTDQVRPHIAAPNGPGRRLPTLWARLADIEAGGALVMGALNQPPPRHSSAAGSANPGVPSALVCPPNGRCCQGLE